MRSSAMVCLMMMVAVGSATAEWLPTDTSTVPTPPTVTVVSNSYASTVVEVYIPGVVCEPESVDGTIYDVIGLPGYSAADRAIGRPQVPWVTLLLGIPDGASVTAEFESLETRTFDSILCYPYQGPQLEDSTYPFVLDTLFYTQDVFYPDSDISIPKTGVWRDFSVASIQACPVKFNPAAGRLLVYSRFRLTVSYSGGAYSHKVIQPWSGVLYARYLDNFDYLDVGMDEYDASSTKYLVVCDEQYCAEPWLRDSLLGWHDRRGVRTRLIHRSGWDSSEVRDSVAAEYGRHDPAELRWVLLVGETHEVPMFGGNHDNVGDYYYSDILPFETPDGYPELGIARLSPMSTSDLANQIAKIIAHERMPAVPDPWLCRGALVSGERADYESCMRDIWRMPKPYWSYAFDTTRCRFGGNEAIRESIELGRGVVIYRGHGNDDRWHHNGPGHFWDIGCVNDLENGVLTPMVYSIACYCGSPTKPCLSEAWLRKYPGGAAGSFAATEPTNTILNNGVCSTIVRALCDDWTIEIPGIRNYTNPAFDIGWIMCNANAYASKNWPTLNDCRWYYNLGDPSMEVWAGGEPQAPTVEHPALVPTRPCPFAVTVSVGGRPVENALVCVRKPDECYVAGYTDNDGEVTLTVSAATQGELTVTVSGGHAHSLPHTPILPYCGSATAPEGFVATASSPFATYPTQARHLARRPNTDDLHIVYQDDGQILYQFSSDGGTSWTQPLAIASGENPCLSLDFDGRPWVTYTSDDHLYVVVKNAADSWRQRLVYCNSDPNVRVGASSFACSNITDETYPRPPDMGYVAFPIWWIEVDGTRHDMVLFAPFDTVCSSGGQYRYTLQTIDEWTSPNAVESLVCIAKTPGDLLHVVWLRGLPGASPEIRYRKTADTVLPFLVRGQPPVFPVWEDDEGFAIADDDLANSPFVEAWGDSVFALWQVGLPFPGGPSDVWRRAKWAADPQGAWGQEVNWSVSDQTSSDYPAMSGSGVVWGNEGLDELGIWTRFELTEQPDEVFNSEQNTLSFPHAEVEFGPPPPQQGDDILRSLFTQYVAENQYAVRFVRYVHHRSGSDDGAYYSANVAQDTISPYCLSRDGVMDYGGIRVDYANQRLRYRLKYLNPLYHYVARLVLYQRSGDTWRQAVAAGDSATREIELATGVPETLWIDIPRRLYRNTKVDFAIRRLRGAHAVLADLRVYQYELPTDRGGAQASGVVPLQGSLDLFAPSIAAGPISFDIRLPAQSAVSLTVLDAAGRRVRVLRRATDGPLASGRHGVSWNLRDEQGRPVPPGVYFCRFETDDAGLCRKLIVIR